MNNLCRAFPAIGALVALSCAASAQVWIRPNVPDLDQRRDPLPGDGAMYCAPTSAIDYMAYLADRGFPNLMLGQTGPWQTSSNPTYNTVTNQIALMGGFMGTTASGGTTGGLHSGLSFYLNTLAPGKFTTYSQYGEVGINNILFEFVRRNLVIIAYGKYFEAGGTWFRDGGHVVAVMRVDVGSSTSGGLGWKDPNTSDSINAQSAFATAFSDTSRQSVSIGFNNVRRWRLWDVAPTSSRRRYVDSMHVIQPLVALSTPTNTGLGLNSAALAVLHPVIMPYSDQAPYEVIPLPDGDTTTDIALHPGGGFAACVTSSAFPTGRWVYVVDLGDGSVRPIASFTRTSPVRIDFDRFGRLLVSSSGVITTYELDERLGWVEVASRAPLDQVDAMQFDDERDVITTITVANHRLTQYPLEGGSPVDRALPTAVSLNSSASLAIDPKSEVYFLGSRQSPTVYVVKPLGPSSGQLVVEQTITAGLTGPVEGITIGDDGALLVSNGSGMTKLNPVMGTGGNIIWTPATTSDFDGFDVNGPIRVARSRTNQDNSELADPGWNNDPEVETDVPTSVECAADLVQPFGVLDFFDVQAFLSAFSSHQEAADLAMPFMVWDFFDVQVYLNAFSQGCP